MKPKVVVFFALATLIAIVIFQNSEVIMLQFLFWKFYMSRILVLTFAVLAGFMLGVLVAKFPASGSKRK